MALLSPQPMEATSTKSIPANKIVLLYSLDSLVADLKTELSTEKVDNASDEGDLDLQQILVEIKDE